MSGDNGDLSDAPSLQHLTLTETTVTGMFQTPSGSSASSSPTSVAPQHETTSAPPPPISKEPDADMSLFNTSQVSIGSSSDASSSTVSNTSLEAAPSATAAAVAAVTEPYRPPRSHRKRRLPSQPRSILKPAPPPQKTFSFRRDILQTINSRLVQQGVYSPSPGQQAGTAQAASNIIGGVFRRIGGIAAGAVAAAGAPVMSEEARLQQSRALASGSSGREDATPLARGESPLTAMAESSDSNATVSVAPLKRVQFAVSSMTVTYPIVGAGTPGDEDITRVRIEKEHRARIMSRKGEGWKPYELEQLYRECCRTREEHPLLKMRSVFLDAARASPPGLRTLDLSLIPLDRGAVEPIADLLSVEFGLTKLVLENCALTDETLKPLLHALLVSGTLPNLSVASNRKIKNTGWRYIAIFMRRAQALRYLDLSENSISRPSLEHIVQALAKSEAEAARPAVTPKVEEEVFLSKADSKAHQRAEEADAEGYDEADALALMPGAPLLRRVVGEAEPLPPSALISLRMENCGLKTAALEQLAQGVRTSNLKHLSLRRNRISQLGAIALAHLLKDYPSISEDGTQRHGVSPSRSGTMPGSPTPRSFSGSTYLNGAGASGSQLSPRPVSPDFRDVPHVVSSPGGGVTSRRMLHAPRIDGGKGSPSRSFTTPLEAGPLSPSLESPAPLTDAERQAARENKHPSLSDEEAVALFQAQRATRLLADLPRIGNLLTLDLKSNDIRTGVSALAHVLRKNRTLRVLNLSDNNIDMSGLVALAEALKYNSTLETLDVSHNPCAGPGLEGITRLRTAFTTNSNLKRLFLNDTDLSSEGAIALAEYLPEAQNLLHLDMTENYAIDIAGVLALAVAVKMNRSLRCLDLNIPPNSPDFAQLSQDILQSCVRNTEAAQRKAAQRGSKAPVAAPIYKSVVARAAKEEDDRIRAAEASKQANSQSSSSKVLKESRDAVMVNVEDAQRIAEQLRRAVPAEEGKRGDGSADRNTSVETNPEVNALVAEAKVLQTRLTRQAGSITDDATLGRLLDVTDDLAASLQQALALQTPKSGPGPDTNGKYHKTSVSEVESDGIPPLAEATFSIGEEEDDDDEESAAPPSRIFSRRAETDTSAVAEDAPVPETAPREKDVVLATEFEREPDEAEIRARSLLSEEGEIFKKAKQLGLTEETVDDKYAAVDEDMAAVPADVTISSTTTIDDADNSLASMSSSTSPSTSGLSTSLSTSTISSASGEDLRKDLLASEVPDDSLGEEDREQSILAEA